MFKTGDIVVYMGEYIQGWGMIPNKIYVVGLVGDDYLYIKNNSIPGLIGPYDLKFFISLTDYRNRKIKKICSKLGMC